MCRPVKWLLDRSILKFLVEKKFYKIFSTGWFWNFLLKKFKKKFFFKFYIQLCANFIAHWSKFKFKIRCRGPLIAKIAVKICAWWLIFSEKNRWFIFLRFPPPPPPKRFPSSAPVTILILKQLIYKLYFFSSLTPSPKFPLLPPSSSPKGIGQPFSSHRVTNYWRLTLWSLVKATHKFGHSLHLPSDPKTQIL